MHDPEPDTLLPTACMPVTSSTAMETCIMPTAIRSPRILAVAALVLATTFHVQAQSAERPLSQILQQAESRGTISMVERERGYWEIVSCNARGECSEHHHDPATGRELRHLARAVKADAMPPPDAQPLSAIVASLEERNLGKITDIEFDDGEWEIDVRSGSGRSKRDQIELHVDPANALITECRGRGRCPQR